MGCHTGVVYRDENDRTFCCHLAFHHDLRKDAFPDDLSVPWVRLTIAEERLDQVAAFCDLVAVNAENGRVPYGFRFESTHIDDEGAVLIGGSEAGLTCATFVLALFRRVGLELLELDSWETRPEDEDAQRKLIEYLRRRASPEHLAAVQTEVGCMRFRAEEVAGATTFERRPVSFEHAEKRGLALVEELQQESD